MEVVTNFSFGAHDLVQELTSVMDMAQPDDFTCKKRRAKEGKVRITIRIDRARKFAPIVSLAGSLLITSVATAQEIESRIARGGLLYDYWQNITDGEVPKGNHPSYPKTSKKVGMATWRCKECHGWDYKGADGYYGRGDSFTGIKGIRALDGGDSARVRTILRDQTHAFTEFMLKPKDIEDLALFVTKGQIDTDKYIDAASKKAKGDAAKGAAYYNTICVKCHGVDGKLPKDMQESVGKLSRRVPWEVMHKISNGEPGKEMPALRAIPSATQVVADILTYAQTLPD